MTYPVPCACGATLQVPGTAAGGRVDCRCGRAVEVPSLGRLKAAAGQVALSPDLELAHLVQAGGLPLESTCVECGRETAHRMAVSVVCETATEDDGEMPTWQKVLVALFTGVHLIRHQSRRAGVYGRDVQFLLPVRLCEACDREATGRAAVADLLARTPVYARLLAKYPGAGVTRIG